MTIKGSLLLSVPIVNPFLAENFPSPTKICPNNGGFSRNWRSKYFFYFQNPQKAHPCVRPLLLTYLREDQFWGLAVASLKNQKTNIEVLYFTHMRRKKPLVGSAQNFALGRYPERNHRCKFGGRLVELFLRGDGSNFRLFHRLSQSF